MLLLRFFFLCALLTSGFPYCFVVPVRFFLEENLFGFFVGAMAKTCDPQRQLMGTWAESFEEKAGKMGLRGQQSVTKQAGSTRAAPWKGAHKPTTRSKRMTNEVSYLRSRQNIGSGMIVAMALPTRTLISMTTDANIPG